MLRLTGFYRSANDAKYICSCLHLQFGQNWTCKLPVCVCDTHERVLGMRLLTHTTRVTDRLSGLNFIPQFSQSGKIWFNSNHVIQTNMPLCISSRYKQTSSRQSHLDDIKSKEYLELYLTRQVTFLRSLCRFAKYSTMIFAAGVPICIGSAQMGAMDVDFATNLATMFTFYFLLFTGQSFLFTSRIIGKIQISKDQEYLKVSHLTLFGDRKDIYVQPSDIVRISNPNKDLFDKKIHPVQFKNYPRKLFLLPHYGGNDTNYEVLEHLFMGNESKKES